jgi:hypothetical protein
MKKYIIFTIFLFFSFSESLLAAELKGLQPVDPFSVFSTFSTESLKKGKSAVSIGAEASIEPDLYRMIFKGAYGLSDIIELDFTLPYVFGSDIGDGYEDFAIGIRHRFFEEKKYGPSLAYMVNFSIPSGSDQLTTDGRFGAGIIVSKRVGPVNGHINLIYENSGTKKLDYEWSFLTGFDFAAAHNFKILSELLVRKSHDSEKVDLIEARIGYRIKTTESIYTSFGAGFDIKNRTPEARMMFNVTFILPPEKKKIKKIYEEEQ